MFTERRTVFELISWTAGLATGIQMGIKSEKKTDFKNNFVHNMHAETDVGQS